ncbi:MAG: hypothetical protein FJ151_04060, partial [Euryarchaeota archaeon]|nr:hypothetical protein [Euryarchaeota archaeon]
MLEGDLIYSVISPAMGFVGLLLGLYALKRNPFLKASRVFAGMISLFFVASILDFGFRNAPDEGTAVLLAKAVFFLVVLVYGAFLYLSSYLPYERRDNWFREHTLLFLLVLLISGAVVAASVDGIALTSFGWSMAESDVVFVFGAIILIFVASTLIVLGRAYRAAEGGQVRLQCLLMGVGVAFPIFWASGLTVLNLLDL